mmetsp:Transcript_9354/g.12264  ORF Transcript_9354/g.12264 Transcript_9354/m.12264 type:complete len:665 (-) Transcript_9354:256-2250(-)
MIRKGVIGSTGVVIIIRELFGRDNFDRTLSFYQVAGPGYLIYKYTDLTTRSIPASEREERFNELHKIWAPRALEKILELRGFYIKIGQMAASNIGNAFPDIWIRTMEVLQNNVPHQDMDSVTATIEKSYGKPIHEVFASFDPVPLGAASIGQVHRATLKPSPEELSNSTQTNTINQSFINKLLNYLPFSLFGLQPLKLVNDDSTSSTNQIKSVVVKIQYPEVEDRFQDDVLCITNFCKIAQPEHVKALHEIQKQFRSEFDYRLEGQNLETVRKNLLIPFPSIIVPTPYLPLCTKHVLVMEDLSPSTKLTDGLRAEEGKIARLRGLTVEELRKEIKIKNEATIACGRPRKGPSAEEMDKLIKILEIQVMTSNMKSQLYNTCFASWFPGATKHKLIDFRDVAPLNHARIIDDLILVHGYEVLIDGCFNGDPHPGNFLLVHSLKPSYGSYLNRTSFLSRFLFSEKENDKEKEEVKERKGVDLNQRFDVGVYTGGDRLGLIDYGQVKHLDLISRLKLARLIVALNVDDKDRIADRLYDMGHRTKYNNKRNHYTMAKLVYDSNDSSISADKHIQHVLDDLEASDPILSVAGEFILVGRVCAMLRGLGYVLHQPRSTSEAWLPLAKHLLIQHGEWDKNDEPLIERYLQNKKKQRDLDLKEEKDSEVTFPK